jgi:hypothetical protein
MHAAHAGTRRLRRVILVLVLALATYVGLTTDARANFFRFDALSPLITRSSAGATEYAYLGPEFRVDGGGSASTDTYECAINQPDGSGTATQSLVTDYLPVVTHLETPGYGDTPWISDLGYSVTSDASLVAGDTFHVTVTPWYGFTMLMHVVASCTTDYNVFGYQYGSYGPYLDRWNASLQATTPSTDHPQQGTPDYVTLVGDAFHWGSKGIPANPASASAASARTRRPGTPFALHNGTNAIRIPFGQVARSGRALARSKRPPAIYLSTQPAGAHCRATQLQVPVVNGSGTVLLNLQCSDLKGGASARLQIHSAIRRSFRLHKGTGRFNIHLDKPPGSIPPFVYVSTHPAKTPCRVVHRKVHLRPRTLDLHMTARCKRVPRKATGTLYVGGLLAANR